MSLNQDFGSLSRALTLSVSVLAAGASAATAQEFNAVSNDNADNVFHCDPVDYTHDSAADIVEKVYPANVLVSSRPTISLPSFVTPPKPGAEPRGQRPEGGSIGSGFVINNQEGYIVTNAHVLEGPDGTATNLDYFVTFYDADAIQYKGEEVKVELVGIGKSSGFDLAVLKVDLEDISGSLHCVELGDSDKVRVGEGASKIGNALGQLFEYKEGSIGHTRQTVGGEIKDHEYIGSSVPVNQGDSGGTLFAMEGTQKGKVIGVNTLILSPTGANIGFAYSIPSNIVKQVVPRLIADGQYKRGWLGVQIRGLNKDDVTDKNLPDETGVLISGLAPDSPAFEGGLKVGDVVTRINDQSVNELLNFKRTIRDTYPGTVVDMTIIRDGEALTLPITIGDQNIALDVEETEPAEGQSPFSQKPPEEFVPDSNDQGNDGGQAPSDPNVAPGGNNSDTDGIPPAAKKIPADPFDYGAPF